MEIFIKNFGPIKTTETKGEKSIKIKKITLFIGPQGSGKSTIIKLISTFLWLEKAIVRGDFEPSSLGKAEFVYYLSYHNIDSYLQDNSEISFNGNVFLFTYSEQKFVIEKQKSSHYIKPKITYFPAERNFISALPNPTAIKGLPGNLFGLINDFYDAGEALESEWLPLPVSSFKYRYDKTTRKSFISKGKTLFENELYQTASGIQSITPLTVICNNNKNLIKRDKFGKSRRQYFSLDELKKIQQDYHKNTDSLDSFHKEAFNNYLKDNNLWLYSIYINNNIITRGGETQTISFFDNSNTTLQTIEKGLDTILNSRFIHIVEEPEQNLFPKAQKDVLYYLFECLNDDQRGNSQLIMTTHSPYILAFLSLSIKASELVSKKKNFKKIYKIIPQKYCICGGDCAVYQLNERGGIRKLSTYGAGIPSDSNYLNNMLNDINIQFNELLDVEESIDD